MDQDWIIFSSYSEGHSFVFYIYVEFFPIIHRILTNGVVVRHCEMLIHPFHWFTLNIDVICWLENIKIAPSRWICLWFDEELLLHWTHIVSQGHSIWIGETVESHMDGRACWEKHLKLSENFNLNICKVVNFNKENFKVQCIFRFKKIYYRISMKLYCLR